MFSKRGFTLIEMIIALVIIGIGVTGLMLVFSNNVRSSSNPLISKQIVAIAEEIMEEILLKPYEEPFTSSPANAATTCGNAAADRSVFDEVLDYNNYQTTGICDSDGGPVIGLENFNLQVSASNIGNWQGIANTLQVTVTVTRGATTFTLTGWRTPS